MATVTGLTATRMLEIEAQSIVNGDVVGDNLILIRHDGETINAGNVRGPSGASEVNYKPVTDFPAAYPLGISTFSVDATVTGWPAQLATVTTVVISSARAFQLLAEQSTSQMWVRAAKNDNTWGPWLSLTGTPAGTINMFAGTTAPAGFLVCDGSAISRSTYAALFAVIGTTYGSGDGTTTFNLPNLKGKVPVGQDSADTQFDVLGETGGAKTHTLSAAEMPSHAHTQDPHNHTQNSHNHTQNSHNHTQNAHAHTNALGSGFQLYTSGLASRGRTLTTTDTTKPAFIGSVDIDGVNYGGFPSTTPTNDVATAVNVATTPTNNPTTATSQSTGGGGAHNNLQPYIVVKYIIKT